jgi:hypothetical protein
MTTMAQHSYFKTDKLKKPENLVLCVVLKISLQLLKRISVKILEREFLGEQ